MAKTKEYMKKYRAKTRGKASPTEKNRGRGDFTPTDQGTMTLAEIEARIDELGKIMEKYSYDAVGFSQGMPGTTREGADRYREAYDEHSELMGMRSRLIQNEQPKPAGSNGGSRTFVNGYGEATNRYITNGAYERAQRRLERRIRSLLGNR